MKQSINVRFTLIFFILFGLVFTISGIVINHFLQDRTSDLLKKRMISISNSISAEFQGVFADYLLESEQNSRFFITVQNRLNQKKETFSLVNIDIVDTSAHILVSTDTQKTYHIPYYPLFSNKKMINRIKTTGIYSTPIYEVHGNPYMSVYVPVKNQNNSVKAIMAVEASADYFQILSRMKRFFYIGFILLILVIFLISFLISRYISNPIKALEKTAADIGTGNLGIQSRNQGRDEIGRLASSINKMSKQLKADRELLDAKIASLEILAGGIAHEIRNPLNGINLYIDLLIRKCDIPDNQEILDKIKGEIKLIDLIVSQLLDYTKPLDLKTEPVRLLSLVDQVSTYVKDMDFKTDIDETLLLRVDSTRFLMVLGNLIRNAAEAAGQGGAILLKANREGQNEIQVEIHNTGPPIPPGIRPKLFEPFFTTKPKGTGLGLAICRKIIEAHRGDIELTDSDISGYNTSVIITLKGEKNGKDNGRG
jgi:signal transduction histidine kinase